MAEPGDPRDDKTGKKPDSDLDGSKKTPENDAFMWRFFGAGIQLAATVGLFALLGWWLDARFGWTPWGLMTCGTLGTAAAMYHFLKDAMK